MQDMSMLNTNAAENLLLLEHRRTQELAYLYQLALDLMAHSDSPISTTCDIVIDSVQMLLNCQSAVIILRDSMSEQLRLTAERGSTDWLTDDLCDQFSARDRALAIRHTDGASYLGVRLQNDDDWIGLLLARREVHYPPFTDDEIQLITLLAGVTATTLINSQLRDSLTERLDMLQTIMESSPGGLLLVEVNNGRLYMANPAAMHALHLRVEELGCPLRIDGPDGLLYERLIEALPPSMTTAFDYRLVMGGRTRTLHLEVVPVSADKLLVQLNDITLLQAVETRREAAVANASHDLKTPLAVINLGLSNLLAYYEETPDAERRQLIEEALEQVGAMRSSISSLLRQSQTKPLSTRATVDPDNPASLDDPIFYIEQVVNELFAFARHQGVQIFWQPPTVQVRTTVRISSSDTDLKTIVRNLISNAVKYTPAGGNVRVEVRLSPPEIIDDNTNCAFTLTVSDSGVGIPPEELHAIFARGYRASTGNLFEGSGLGLSFVKEAIERSSGTIQVESQVGIGSVFTVQLPCLVA
jgi:two-component system phosphate regulon sensor histidine kinase PhoR